MKALLGKGIPFRYRFCTLPNQRLVCLSILRLNKNVNCNNADGGFIDSNAFLGERVLVTSAVILAGGASRRMQTNKALIELFQGVRMIDYVINRLEPVFDDIVVVTNDPELYDDIKARVVTDLYPRCGPLSGIHAGLSSVKADKALVLACDMPFFSMELAHYLMGEIGSSQALIPVYQERLQSLSAVYHCSVATAAETLLVEGQHKLRLLFERIEYKVLKESDISPFGDPARLFTNVNTRDCLDQARNLLGM